MFCAKCGTQFEFGAAFCARCGHSMVANQQIENMRQNQNPGRKTVIKRANAKTSTIAAYWVAIVIGFISSFVLLGLYFYVGELATQYRYRTSGLAEMKPLIAFMVFMVFAMDIVQIIKAINLAKTFICVCEEGVYGVAGKTLDFSTQPFEVGYDQITNVGKGNAMIGNVKIECGPYTYGCIVSEPNEVIGMIAERTNRQRYV